jgi:hypothetical protein
MNATTPRPGLRRVLTAAIALLAGGCVGPVTQWQCDDLAREALRAVASGNEQAVARYVGPERAADLVAAQPALQAPRIEYLRDHYPWPGQTYHRWYTLAPGAGDPNAPPRDYRMIFRHDPEADLVRLRAIHRAFAD